MSDEEAKDVVQIILWLSLLGGFGIYGIIKFLESIAIDIVDSIKLNLECKKIDLEMEQLAISKLTE